MGASAAIGVALTEQPISAQTKANFNIPNHAANALRLVSFIPAQGGADRVGIVIESRHVVDLGALASAKHVKLGFDPMNMVSLIAAGAPALQQIAALLALGPVSGPAVNEVTLLAPIPRPTRNVYAVGWNYLDHFEEGVKLRGAGIELPEHPAFFSKAVHSVNGPYSPIPFDPSVSTHIDWEGELAVIIGKGGKNIREEDALDHVFGYSVFNDTTARDIQHKRHGEQWFKGKSLDGHGPFGPWIIPASYLDFNNLTLITRVNGIVKQQANTAQMYFKVPRIIAELSLGLTLEPGDIIATGTPSGVGYARTPQEFMKPGDVMETEIVEIGMIRNVIKAV